MEKSVSVFLQASPQVRQLRADTPGAVSHLHFLGNCLVMGNFFQLMFQLPERPRRALCHMAEGRQAGHCPISHGGCNMNCYVCFDYATYLLWLPKKRQDLAQVFLCVDDIRRDHCSITSVCNPLHYFLFAHAMVGDQYKMVMPSILCMRR